MKLLWRTFSQVAGAGITKKLQPGQRGSIGLSLSHQSPLLKIWSQPLPCLQQAPFLTNTVLSLPLQKGRCYQITKSLVPPFSSFLRRCPAASTQSGPLLARCLPDMPVAPAAVALCHSSSNCGGRTIRSPQSASPTPWQVGIMCILWILTQIRVGKWFNPSLNPGQTPSLETVQQHRQILGSKGEEIKLGWETGGHEERGRNLKCNKGGDDVLPAQPSLTRNQSSVQTLFFPTKKGHFIHRKLAVFEWLTKCKMNVMLNYKV